MKRSLVQVSNEVSGSSVSSSVSSESGLALKSKKSCSETSSSSGGSSSAVIFELDWECSTGSSCQSTNSTLLSFSSPQVCHHRNRFLTESAGFRNPTTFVPSATHSRSCHSCDSTIMSRSRADARPSFVTPERAVAESPGRSISLSQELKETNDRWISDGYDEEVIALMDSIDPVPPSDNEKIDKNVADDHGPSESVSRRSTRSMTVSFADSTRRITRSQAGRGNAKSPPKKNVRAATKKKKHQKRSTVLATRIKRNLVRKNIPQKVQDSWDNANENTKRYEKSKQETFNRMLAILSKHGGAELAELAEETVEDELEEVPLLIHVLRECEDRRYFLIILDECMKFFIEFAKQENGAEYSTGTMRIMVRRIFAYMKMRYSIHVAESDFASEGTFRARLSDIWTEERKKKQISGVQKEKVKFVSTMWNTCTMQSVMAFCCQKRMHTI